MITYKLNSNISTDVIGEWMKINNMFERVSFDWVKKHLVFEYGEDATAFSLRFGIKKIETTLDKMIKNEESIN